SKGEYISALFFENPSADYTILFSHGNAEDIFSSDGFTKESRDKGFNVFVYDYHGYGINKGKPSEQNSYEDAETAYDYLINDLKIAPEKIIIFGRSLGGAISIDLASRKKCGGLIAESTFTSAFRVLTHYRIYPFDKFNSLGKIKNVRCPVLFIHGKEDEVIPFWHSEILFAAANEPKFFFSLDNANHNNVSDIGGEDYFQAIKDFANTLPK
ncbi:MAG: alpha/beta hydrolase, partial [Pyrinomonadaceae bacterium]